MWGGANRCGKRVFRPGCRVNEVAHIWDEGNSILGARAV